jgi:hypothetical protein
MNAKINFGRVSMDVEIRQVSTTMISFYLPTENDTPEMWALLTGMRANISMISNKPFVNLPIKEDVAIEYHK